MLGILIIHSLVVMKQSCFGFIGTWLSPLFLTRSHNAEALLWLIIVRSPGKIIGRLTLCLLGLRSI